MAGATRAGAGEKSGGRGRAGSERRVRAARRLLLDPSRIARDLDCGRILSVDGWVLARSEVALAVFAHGASQRGATEPEAARLPG
jgi:hypothetical protein